MLEYEAKEAAKQQMFCAVTWRNYAAGRSAKRFVSRGSSIRYRNIHAGTVLVYVC